MRLLVRHGLNGEEELAMEVPTAEQYQSLVTALYEKDVVELCYLLGQGLDLTWPFPDSGHISTLLALAMFRD